MIRLKLKEEDFVRVITNERESTSFFLHGRDDGQGISIDFYSLEYSIEIRRKDKTLRMFMIEKDRPKKYYNFGDWEDAEVIFSYSEI